MSNIIDKPAFVVDLQKYIVNQPIVRQELFNSLDDTIDYFVVNASGETPIMKLRKSGSFIQPSNQSSDWSPKGSITSSVRKVNPRYGKLDLEQDVQQLNDTFLDTYRGPLASQTAPNFLEYFLNVIRGGMTQEIGEGMWQGLGYDYAAAADYHLHITKGYLEILKDEVTANNISVALGNMVVTGAITESNIYDAVKSIYAKIPAKYKLMPLDIYLSPNLMHWYEEDYKNQFGHVVYENEYRQKKTPFGNCTFKPKWQMGDSQRIIFSVPKNLTIGVRDMLVNQPLNVKDYKPRAVSIWTDLAYDVNFATLDEIWVNNQA